MQNFNLISKELEKLKKLPKNVIYKKLKEICKFSIFTPDHKIGWV